MKAKKVLAMLMASAMIMGTSVTAFAAPVAGMQSTTITITNPDTDIPEDANLNYGYVQIVQRNPELPQGWEFTNDIYIEKFKDAFGMLEDATEEDVLEQLFALYKEEKVNDNAENGTILTNIDLGEALTALSGYATNPVINNTIPATTAGLYLIVGHATGYTWSPMLAYVDETEGGVLVEAKVQAKASKDQISKEIVVEEGETDTGKTVMGGDVIPYKITAEYPYYPAESTGNVFTITDKVSNATINQASVTVEGFVKDKDYSLGFSEDGTEMTVNFFYNHANAGKPVVINYNVTVGDISDGENVQNDAKSTIKGGYTKSTVITDSAEFTVKKIESVDDGEIVLPDAEFTVYVEVSNSGAGTTTISYDKDNDGIADTVNVKQVGNPLITGEDGTATIKGLDVEKTYYVKETKAPAGYSLNDTVYKLVLENEDNPITENTTTETLKDENEYEYTLKKTTYTVCDFKEQPVVDTKLSELPSTGGIGTTIFTIGGCAIMVTAAGLYFATRKKTEK